jgi:hypothetical protein
MPLVRRNGVRRRPRPEQLVGALVHRGPKALLQDAVFERGDSYRSKVRVVREHSPVRKAGALGAILILLRFGRPSARL